MNLENLSERLGIELKKSDLGESIKTEGWVNMRGFKDNDDGEWVRITDEKELDDYKKTEKRLISITEEEFGLVKMETYTSYFIDDDGKKRIFADTIIYDIFSGNSIGHKIYKKK